MWPGCGGCASWPPSTYPVKDVVKAVWAGDVEAEEQDAGVRVEQGPQAVIVDLSWEAGEVTPSELLPTASSSPTFLPDRAHAYTLFPQK